MSRTQLLLCLFGISAVFFNNVEARLEGEGIIGGELSREGQFPYQVALEVGGKNICGGSILSERFVLTAAHCVIDQKDHFTRLPTKVIAGTSDLNSTIRITVNVAKVFVPKEYDAREETQTSRSTADIAVLELRRDLDLEGNSKLGKVKLPEKDKTYAGKKAIVSGFGFKYVDVHVDYDTKHAEEVNGETDGKMRYANATVSSNDECQRIYNEKNPIENSHLCAAAEQHDEDEPAGVCNGDSGGPLVYEGVQIGVASTSPLGCDEDDAPAVYTRVSDYVDFINDVVEGRIDESIRATTLYFVSKVGRMSENDI